MSKRKVIINNSSEILTDSSAKERFLIEEAKKGEMLLSTNEANEAIYGYKGSGESVKFISEKAIDEKYAKKTDIKEQVQADWTETKESSASFIQNKPTLGTAAAKNVPVSGDASDEQVVMGNDTRLMSKDEKDKLNGIEDGAQKNVKPDWSKDESDVSGILNKPALGTASAKNIPASGDASADEVVMGSDSRLFTAEERSKLGGIEDGAQKNVNSDWSETNESSASYIKSKPNLGTAAEKDVPVSGDASDEQVVIGSDSRLLKDEERKKLSGIEAGAQVNVKPDWNAAKGDKAEILNKPSIPTKASEIAFDGEHAYSGLTGEDVKTSIIDIEQAITDNEKVTSEALNNINIDIDNLKNAQYDGEVAVEQTIGTAKGSVSITNNDGKKHFTFTFSGIKGEKGQDGVIGKDGKSAYEIAQEKGYTGTTEEWLASLKGEQGIAAGFGNISATLVNPTADEPKVEVGTTGDNTAKNITFTFSGLKGDPGTGITVKASKADCTKIGDTYIDEDGNLQLLESFNESEPVFRNCGKIKGPDGKDGRGIASVTSSESTEDDGFSTYTFSYTDDSAPLTIKVKNGSKGSTGEAGASFVPSVSDDGKISWAKVSNPQDMPETKSIRGPQGERGYYFTPSVTESGLLEWSNNGGLENPTAVNIKGSDGNDGAAAGFGTPEASVDATTGEPSVKVTSSGPNTAKVFDFSFSGLKGEKGEQGAAAGFGTPTASVDATIGTPSVEVTASGENTSKVFTFKFSGLKGEKGDKGEQGTGINVKASKELCTEDGDAYIDNDNSSVSYGHILIYNSSDKSFTDGGEVKGPDGVGISDVEYTESHLGGGSNTFRLKYTNGNYSPTFSIRNGRNGSDGNDGVTPTIGANGNWYIGTTDTEKPSRGENGTSAEFGDITATIDNSAGIPSVKVSTSENNGKTDISFAFSSLKGEQGETGPYYYPIISTEDEKKYLSWEKATDDTYITAPKTRIDPIYYIPSVDAKGNLSWTNNGDDLDNPSTVNIKGPQGEKGDQGAGINVKASESECTETGDAYINNDQNSEYYGHILILKIEGSTRTFVDGGEVKGPQGAAGRGISGITYVEGNEKNYLTFKYTDGTNSDSIAIKNGTDGNDGAPAGFGEVTASVDDGTGTPEVTVTTGGTNTALNLTFGFKNLKGEKGDPGTDGTDGLPGADGTDGKDATEYDMIVEFSSNSNGTEPASYKIIKGSSTLDWNELYDAYKGYSNNYRNRITAFWFDSGNTIYKTYYPIYCSNKSYLLGDILFTAVIDKNVEVITINRSGVKGYEKYPILTGLSSTSNTLLKTSGNSLESKVTINYDESSKQLQLLGVDDDVISYIDATAFIKDGMLSDAELVVNPSGKDEGTYIKLTWNTDSDKGNTPMYIDVTSLIDIYTAKEKGGLILEDNAFSIDTDIVATKGYVTGITTPIDAKINDFVCVKSFGGKTGEILIDSDDTSNGYVTFKMGGDGQQTLSGKVHGLTDTAFTAKEYFATSDSISTITKDISDIKKCSVNNINILGSPVLDGSNIFLLGSSGTTLNTKFEDISGNITNIDTKITEVNNKISNLDKTIATDTTKAYLVGKTESGTTTLSNSTLKSTNEDVYTESGNLYAAGFYETSDETLKWFTGDIPVDFEALKSIPKQYFIWRNRETPTNIGTSAQKVQKVYPELVSESDGHLTVDYAKLSIVALKAIDVLNERIEVLENEIKVLKAK